MTIPSPIVWKGNLPYSPRFQDTYFSKEGGYAESEYVFLKHNQLPERWINKTSFVIAEAGFGTGLNCLMTLFHWNRTRHPHQTLKYISIEKYPLPLQELKKNLSLWPDLYSETTVLLNHYPPLEPGFHSIVLKSYHCELVLCFGDILEQLSQLPASVDAWYLDGFAPSKNPEMWTQSIFDHMAKLTNVEGTFSTYTAAGFVRRGLEQAGFVVKKSKGFGRKREMLYGTF